LLWDLKKQSQFYGKAKVKRKNESKSGIFQVGYLKKQSQFAGGQIGVSSYLKGKYGNKSACATRKNKPNSKPIFNPKLH
jgi:hypothetical protein